MSGPGKFSRVESNYILIPVDSAMAFPPSPLTYDSKTARVLQALLIFAPFRVGLARPLRLLRRLARCLSARYDGLAWLTPYRLATGLSYCANHEIEAQLRLPRTRSSRPEERQSTIAPLILAKPEPS